MGSMQARRNEMRAALNEDNMVGLAYIHDPRYMVNTCARSLVGCLPVTMHPKTLVRHL